jgi:hypothetical protein
MKRILMTGTWVLLVAAWQATSFVANRGGADSQALAQSLTHSLSRAAEAVGSLEGRFGSVNAHAVLKLLKPSVVWKREAFAFGRLADAAHERGVEPFGSGFGRLTRGTL